MCKRLSQLLPSLIAWALILTCTAAFYFFMHREIIDKWAWLGVGFLALDVAIFLMVLSNLTLAMCMDPGIHPYGSVSYLYWKVAQVF
ncbi:hypothetical protein WR25_01981 [Diploscapter pachys]|uniref:Uncharacterized protein n=1 Tax=Diploscapter pachys TaxID=2018661 RepID=A0A2A2KJY6_9BILA|nr:hypothetical protein WR25_01981 [Diploscapter pachys]